MKLKDLMKEDASTSSKVLLIFDKLQTHRGFMNLMSRLRTPRDRHEAIIKFASLLGIPEGKFYSFMNNLRKSTPNAEI